MEKSDPSSRRSRRECFWILEIGASLEGDSERGRKSFDPSSSGFLTLFRFSPEKGGLERAEREILEVNSDGQRKVEKGAVSVVRSRKNRDLELGEDGRKGVADPGIVVGGG